jgi:hypothetical protein
MKLRLPAVSAVVAELAIDLPMLRVAELEQEFAGLPSPLRRPMPGVQRVVALGRSYSIRP